MAVSPAAPLEGRRRLAGRWSDAVAARGRRDRLRARRDGGRAGAARLSRRASAGDRHDRVLRAVRGVPARPARQRRPAALEPDGVLGPAVRGRRAVGRRLSAGAARLRAAVAELRARRAHDLPLRAGRARRLRVRAAGRGRTARLGLRGDRLRRLGPPRRALDDARPAGRCRVAPRLPGGGRARGARAPRPRPAAVLLLALSLAGSILAGSQQLAAVAAISAGLWLLLRAGRRGVLLALAGVAAAALLSAVALLPRLELLASLLVGGGRRRSERHRLARVPRPARVLRAVRRQPQRADDALRRRGDAGARAVRAARAVVRRARALAPSSRSRSCGRPGSPAGCSGRFRSCTASRRTSRCARWRSRCWPLAVLAGLALARIARTREPSSALLVACFVVSLALGFGDAWKLAFVLPLLAVALCLPALGSRTFLRSSPRRPCSSS